MSVSGKGIDMKGTHKMWIYSHAMRHYERVCGQFAIIRLGVGRHDLRKERNGYYFASESLGVFDSTEDAIKACEKWIKNRED